MTPSSLQDVPTFPPAAGRIHRALISRYLPVWLALIALLLTAPAIRGGSYVDDRMLEFVLLGGAGDRDFVRSPLQLFAFYRGDPAAAQRYMDRGLAPWWTDPQLKVAFFRPLSAVTHWLDWRLWPTAVWAMHLQSIAWFLGVIVVVALLYRRMLRPAWVAGLAALLFAIDDAHGMPAVWIANRNASVAALFAFLAIGAHHRWRSKASRPAMVLAPLLLALGLMSGETALGAAGYLVAYAVVLERGTFPRRLVTLAPAGVVLAAWAIAYKLLDYGVAGSAMYVDPGSSPVAFARAVVERAPLLLFGQFGLPAGIYATLSESGRAAMWFVACAFVTVIAVLLAPLARRDRLARFFALGMLLAVLPACGTVPDDRLLYLVGFGGMGLLAQWFAAMRERAAFLPLARPPWRATARVAIPVLLVVHLVFAPLGLASALRAIASLDGTIERAARTLPADRAIGRQQLVVVNTPAAFISMMGLLVPRLEGRPVPARLLIVGSGIEPIHITRPDARSLLVHPEGGFLARAGSGTPESTMAPPVFDPRYLMPMFDALFRAATMRVGETIRLTDVTVEVLAVTADGRPDRVMYRFDTDLEDPGRRWVQWRLGVYVPFGLPPVGHSIVLPAVAVPF